jgi:hypothetical protein
MLLRSNWADSFNTPMHPRTISSSHPQPPRTLPRIQKHILPTTHIPKLKRPIPTTSLKPGHNSPFLARIASFICQMRPCLIITVNIQTFRSPQILCTEFISTVLVLVRSELPMLACMASRSPGCHFWDPGGVVACIVDDIEGSGGPAVGVCEFVPRVGVE